MAQSDVIPSSVVIVHLDCPMCAKRMMLVRIEPDSPDHDRRTLDCVSCGYAETFVVTYAQEARAVS
jgi:C4-type Zn-finger protein